MRYASVPLRRAAVLRRQAARFLTPDAPAGARAGYLLLRRARMLELDSAFALPAAGGLELNSWCAALLEAAAQVCPLPPGALRFRGAGGPLPVAGRGAVLEAAVLQAVCNSLQYAGPRPALELRLQAADGRVLLYYKDSGPGLVPAARPGFGIRAARAFARQAGGSFAARGGAGFCCGFSLPLCRGLPLLPPPCPAELVEDRFSPVYIHLAPRCILPE